MDAWLITVAVDQQLARVTLRAHPRLDAIFANAPFCVEIAPVQTILVACLRTVKAVIRGHTVVAYAAALVQQTPSLAFLVTLVAAFPGEEAITFAAAIIPVERAVDAVQIALVALLTSPVSITLALAFIRHLSILAFGDIAVALAFL